MYVIIGCSTLGISLYEELERRKEDVVILNHYGEDKEQNLDNVKITSYSGVLNRIDDVEAILMISEDIDKNIEFLNKIEDKGNIHIIGLVNDIETEMKYKDIGVDTIITINEKIKDYILNELDYHNETEKSLKLERKIKDEEGHISIFLHNNPDPDAIASAMAFEKLCEENHKKATTYYSGKVGHPENEIFLESTGFEMEKIKNEYTEDIIDESDMIVFIDFAKASVNNILPEQTKADIILDHHYTNKEIQSDCFIDIRTDVGATSTILTKHLQNLKIKISSLLASALLYGIKVDTHDYVKNIWPSDFKIITYLSALADKELLDIFESPPLDPNTVSALGRAISNRKFEGGVITAYMGSVAERDDIPQVADLLSREKDIVTVLAFGRIEDDIYLSARSKSLKINIGEKMKKAFSEIGEAGGHSHSAGGKININQFDNEDEAVEEIEKRFNREVL